MKDILFHLHHLYDCNEMMPITKGPQPGHMVPLAVKNDRYVGCKNTSYLFTGCCILSGQVPKRKHCVNT